MMDLFYLAGYLFNSLVIYWLYKEVANLKSEHTYRLAQINDQVTLLNAQINLLDSSVNNKLEELSKTFDATKAPLKIIKPKVNVGNRHERTPEFRKKISAITKKSWVIRKQKEEEERRKQADNAFPLRVIKDSQAAQG